MRLSRKLGYNGFIEMYYKLLGAVGGVSRGYEVNEDFVSHFAGKEAVSLENYQNLRRAAEKICATPDTVFIYGMGFSSMMANYLGKNFWFWVLNVFYQMGQILLVFLKITWSP